MLAAIRFLFLRLHGARGQNCKPTNEIKNMDKMIFCKPRRAFGAVFAAIALAAGAAQGQTVDWGTDATFTSDAAQLSDGTQMPGSLIWSLGYFETGFIPDATNYDMWAANYVSVDTSFWQESFSIWSVPGHVDDVGEVAAGRQIYTFAYNDLGLIGTPEGEAFLFRINGNVFPAVPNPDNAQIPDNPYEPYDDDVTLIWGRADRTSYGIGGIITGGGLITDPAPDSVAGEFSVQTATWAPIPEPASTGLLALAGALCLRRKRSSKSLSA